MRFYGIDIRFYVYFKKYILLRYRYGFAYILKNATFYIVDIVLFVFFKIRIR